jgi:hypothetical protein
VAASGSQALRLRMSSESGMCCLAAGRVLAADQVRDGSEMIVFVGEGQRLYIKEVERGGGDSEAPGPATCTSGDPNFVPIRLNSSS